MNKLVRDLSLPLNFSKLDLWGRIKLINTIKKVDAKKVEKVYDHVVDLFDLKYVIYRVKFATGSTAKYILQTRDVFATNLEKLKTVRLLPLPQEELETIEPPEDSALILLRRELKIKEDDIDDIWTAVKLMHKRHPVFLSDIPYIPPIKWDESTNG